MRWQTACLGPGLWPCSKRLCRRHIAKKTIALGHEMIQMHGWIGGTDELNIGQGHKRLMTLARFPGVVMLHLTGLRWSSLDL